MTTQQHDTDTAKSIGEDSPMRTNVPVETVNVTRAQWHHAVQIMATDGALKTMKPSGLALIGLAAGHYVDWGRLSYGQVEISNSRVQSLLQAGSNNTAIAAIDELERVGLWKLDRVGRGNSLSRYKLVAPVDIIERAKQQLADAKDKNGRAVDAVAVQSDGHSRAVDDAQPCSQDAIAVHSGVHTNTRTPEHSEGGEGDGASAPPPTPQQAASSSSPPSEQTLKEQIAAVPPPADQNEIEDTIGLLEALDAETFNLVQDWAKGRKLKNLRSKDLTQKDIYAVDEVIGDVLKTRDRELYEIFEHAGHAAAVKALTADQQRQEPDEVVYF
jgi:hypothetical protein